MFCAKINADCPHRVFKDSACNEFEKWLEATEISQPIKDDVREKTEFLKKL